MSRAMPRLSRRLLPFTMKNPNRQWKTPLSAQNPNCYILLNPNSNPNRFFSASSRWMEIVDLVRRDEPAMESDLNRKNLSLSNAAMVEILRLLNENSISSLRFFNWALKCSALNPNSEVYNIVVDNLGRVDDYNAMLLMLDQLCLKKHCLDVRSFAFLTTRSSPALDNSVKGVVDTLQKVTGSCRGSGTYSLIKVLCGMNSFDLAVFVMEETVSRTSYYNVLIAAKCRNGYFESAHDVLNEMRAFGCDPNIKSYNYLLGSLFKNKRVVEACDLMQSMEETGYFPDSITYEVVAFHACKAGRMDFATKVLNRMLCEGIRPRLTMHAAFIKGYFWSGRVEDAYKYVADVTVRDKCSASMNYSLLARLFWLSRRVVEAGGVLHDMMEKGLRPNFPVYVKVTKDLYKMARGDLALQLKSMILKFNSSSEAA